MNVLTIGRRIACGTCVIGHGTIADARECSQAYWEEYAEYRAESEYGQRFVSEYTIMSRWHLADAPDMDEPEPEFEECEHGLSAYLCAGYGHYSDM